MSHETLMELAPLYALDALEGAELKDFESHIVDCEACRREIDAVHETAAAFIPDGPAPAGVWSRIVDEISEPASVTELRPKARSTPRWTVLTSVAAAIAVLLGGVAVVQRGAINDLTGEGAVAAAAADAADTPGSYVGDFLVDGSSVAQVVLTTEGQGYVIPTSDLQVLEPNRTYQLWVLTPDEKVISAGVLGSDPTDSTFTWSGDVSGFALTDEVAGGVVSSEGELVSVATEA